MDQPVNMFPGGHDVAYIRLSFNKTHVIHEQLVTKVYHILPQKTKVYHI